MNLNKLKKAIKNNNEYRFFVDGLLHEIKNLDLINTENNLVGVDTSVELTDRWYTIPMFEKSLIIIKQLNETEKKTFLD